MTTRIALVGFLSLLLLSIPVAALAQPTNDDVAGATRVTAVPFDDTLDVADAGVENDEPTGGCAPFNNTVWYRLRLSSDAAVFIDTAGSAYDTTLAVWEGSSFSDAELLRCNDDAGGLQAALTVGIDAGVTYLVQVGSYGDSPADATLEIAFDSVRSPLNDDAADAIDITGFPFDDVVTLDGATVEPDEPEGGCAPFGNTVWYRLSVSEERDVSVDTSRSTFDTTLAVWEGTSFDDVTLVVCNDDASGLQAAATFGAVPGSTYLIQVGAFQQAPPGARLRIDVEPVARFGQFWDDDGSVFESDIEWLVATGVTTGCNPPTNTRFCPGQSVTRGQMAAFLHRALPDLPIIGSGQFSDDDGSIFEADIEWLAATGVTKGCNPPANTRFCPDDSVTRGQMAALLVRALGLTDDGGGNTFTDDDGNVFERDIARIATAGITKGCNPPANTLFCPDDPVTRAQMAAFLHRALG